MQQKARIASLFPAQPSLGLRQSRRYLLLNPFIVSARLRVCSPPSHLARAIRPPFLHPSTSSCHRAAIFQACPALRAPSPSRAFNRERSPRQMWLQAWVASLFPAQPSLGLRQSRRYLLLNPFIVSTSQRVCSPPSHFARAIRPPLLRPSTISCHRAAVFQARPALRALGPTRA
jgi:hypothetical protein